MKLTTVASLLVVSLAPAIARPVNEISTTGSDIDTNHNVVKDGTPIIETLHLVPMDSTVDINDVGPGNFGTMKTTENGDSPGQDSPSGTPNGTPSGVADVQPSDTAKSSDTDNGGKNADTVGPIDSEPPYWNSESPISSRRAQNISAVIVSSISSQIALDSELQSDPQTALQTYIPATISNINKVTKVISTIPVEEVPINVYGAFSRFVDSVNSGTESFIDDASLSPGFLSNNDIAAYSSALDRLSQLAESLEPLMNLSSGTIHLIRFNLPRQS